jgi:hypothetical protein
MTTAVRPHEADMIINQHLLTQKQSATLRTALNAFRQRLVAGEIFSLNDGPTRAEHIQQTDEISALIQLSSGA